MIKLIQELRRYDMDKNIDNDLDNTIDLDELVKEIEKND